MVNRHNRNFLLLGVTVSLLFLFQNCADNYNPSNYENALASTGTPSGPASPSPTPSTPPLPPPPPAEPLITAEPQAVTIYANQAFSLSVTATGSDLIYQWTKDGTDIAGANAATYSVASAAVTDGGTYAVTIMNGGGTVASTPVAVTVNTYKWVVVGASNGLNQLPPTSYSSQASPPLDPTCTYSYSANSSTYIHMAGTSLVGTACTVSGAYCLDDYYSGVVDDGFGDFYNYTSWILEECQ